MHMVMEGVAYRWRTLPELRRAMGEAVPVARAEVYCSESLRIKRVATMTVGTYYIVTESDVLFSEDYTAMRKLDVELGARWKNRIVESDFYGHPHRWFPLSNQFQVHLVHPELLPAWSAIDRQV